jgi:hypothetical protein
MNAKINKKMAEDCRLVVEVICQMRHCALIRFGDRESVADTSDLVVIRQFRRAA